MTQHLSVNLPRRVSHAVILPLMASMLLVSATGYALSAEEKGFAIAARSDRSDRGFKDSRVELKMILRNAAGSETTRLLRLDTLEVPDETLGDKSLIVFASPPDINGTALLSHANILEPDRQWLFLPALKRTKRISSVNKSGPFVGSEFAFEDLTALELRKYDYRYIRTEPCGELDCDVIERYPLYKYSGYTRLVTWIDTRDYQVRRVEFHDRRDELLKTLLLQDYRQYGPGLWRSHRFLMSNHQTGKSTELVYSDFHFGTGLRERDFVRQRLKRVR